jgi:alcohol dehydrogenase class IV
MSNVVIGEGAAEELRGVLNGMPDPVLVVRGGDSYEQSGARARVEAQLEGRSWRSYQVRGRLPGLEPVREALVGRENPGMVVAVGGGLVIDTAKLIALATSNGLNLIDEPARTPAVEMVAIPTTSGSGSERTPFAVAYRGTDKHSVSHPSIRPAHALVDPTLTYSSPPELTAQSGLDVIAHAMESAWAASATPESSALSLEALRIAWSAIGDAVRSPSPSNRSAMALASTTAGEAIATAKTTASHAMSYHLTAVHGIPHGIAAAITLGPVLVFNSGVDASNVQGPRPDWSIREAIRSICATIGAEDAEQARSMITDLMTDIGVPTTLNGAGIDPASVIETTASAVNEERLSNNPRAATQSDLQRLLAEVA